MAIQVTGCLTILLAAFVYVFLRMDSCSSHAWRAGVLLLIGAVSMLGLEALTLQRPTMTPGGLTLLWIVAVFGVRYDHLIAHVMDMHRRKERPRC